MRMIVTLAVIVLIVWFVMSLYRGRRVREFVRHSARLAPFPRPPAELTGPEGAALLPATTGMYLGTAMAGDWSDQITVGDVGLPTPATLYLSYAGLLVDRADASPLWVPASAVRGARTGRSVAGRVVDDEGMLVVVWQLGGHIVDSAFRGDESVYPDWLRMLRELARQRPSGTGRGAAGAA